MIVVDTNIVIYLMLEDASNKCRKADDVSKIDPNWLLPGLWRHEYLNALSNYLRQGLLHEARIINMWCQGISFFEKAERPIDQVRALENSKRYGVSAYDAQFLTLAEMAGVPLLTEDKKLRLAAPGLTCSMDDFLK